MIITCNLPKQAQERAWMSYEHLTLCNIFVYALIYALAYQCTCMKERQVALHFLH